MPGADPVVCGSLQRQGTYHTCPVTYSARGIICCWHAAKSRAHRDADTAGTSYAASLADAVHNAASRCGGYKYTRGVD